MTTAHPKKVIVGLSGGVDSSVAALLLQQQGYDVHGAFMQNWETDSADPFCTTHQDLADARDVCERLNIPFHTICFAEEYWNKVFKLFLDGYAAGYTPNPDILCNKEIKFKAFLEYALAQGADYIAMGHYANISQNNGEYQLLKGWDGNKDQSYFLYTLQSHQLAHTLFPLGHLPKPEVRKIAQKAGLPNYSKKDSTGICFIGERRFKDFLSEYLLARPGDIETVQGEKIGSHHGLMFYTLGQRQGLGIGGHPHATGSPWYVLDKNIAGNTLIVGQSQNHPLLFKTSLHCHQLHWVAAKEPEMPLICSAKIRYRQTDASCTLTKLSDDHWKVDFSQPQRAITPGQSVVFYQEEVCLGGGIIL